ncbi:citrate (Si)-synthase [Candidatus Neptunochlamydia vexilliferae]|uniref:citrate (Si)-synthase n=1 Tax=Candidatus Neptunichlamydia vexilliferae TaxID=1651774 RepID=UPI0018911B84|nr:citrate (Si)-synthase [Candidatus Neptunochlamydia vexilliferae]
MEDVLFQVTKDQLETGMRGYPVGYCTTSFVDPEKGLFYRGRPISELYKWEPERVLFFLLNGKEGSAQEITTFSDELKRRAHCSHAVIKHIESLPRQGHPMKLFSGALLVLGMLEGQDDYKEDALNLIAKLPHLSATVINYHAGWGETPPPTGDKGYMENFAHMLQVPDRDGHLSEVFRLFNILHYDHGGGNLSTFVGKAIASGLEDLYGSIGGAMCALAGPLHGRANQSTLALVEETLKEVGENATAADIEQFVRKKLENKEKIFGFGHAVLRKEDARATIFYDYAEKHFADHPLVKIAFLLRTEGTKVLKENPKISNPYPNIDAMSGTLLTAVGFPYPEYYTVLFGLSRSVGIATQIVYERLEAREGKGTPIVRPRYIYKPH